MGLGDLGSGVIIIIIFITLVILSNISSGISHIKNNWDDYKCRPGIIPIAFIFGHEVKTTFNECIKNTQSDYMATFMDPINKILGDYAKTGSMFTSMFEDMKIAGNTQDSNMTDFASLVSNKLYNIGNEFNEILIYVNDTFFKLSSSISILYYMVQASIGASRGAMSGLIGTIIKTVSG